MKTLRKSDFFTIEEIAKLTNRSTHTVYRWIREGRMESFKTKLRTVYVNKKEVERFLTVNQIPIY
ncbi:helix-turn-helix domain-containing protein [Methanosphaerula palustris]|uniref:DNA binding domain protein, excisionase family n=1 Tax=Methanosphaerula palustris (strain ATCC BAA-1556 / DSM 19958 / E1-9c) TaxID=521011 RepID=B8GF16_METPE|nr:DNA binding domain protein, excisionase family [Methanosphaerula palustris E1-9c]